MAPRRENKSGRGRGAKNNNKAVTKAGRGRGSAKDSSKKNAKDNRNRSPSNGPGNNKGTRGNPRRNSGGRGRPANNKEVKKPVTADELDSAMDDYWMKSETWMRIGKRRGKQMNQTQTPRENLENNRRVRRKWKQLKQMQLQLLNPLLRLPKNNGKWKIQHRVWNEVQKFRGEIKLNTLFLFCLIMML